MLDVCVWCVECGVWSVVCCLWCVVWFHEKRGKLWTFCVLWFFSVSKGLACSLEALGERVLYNLQPSTHELKHMTQINAATVSLHWSRVR
jgi:hypothetical protein